MIHIIITAKGLMNFKHNPHHKDTATKKKQQQKVIMKKKHNPKLKEDIRVVVDVWNRAKPASKNNRWKQLKDDRGKSNDSNNNNIIWFISVSYSRVSIL